VLAPAPTRPVLRLPEPVVSVEIDGVPEVGLVGLLADWLVPERGELPEVEPHGWP
jgi:hypothetical protein